MITEKSITPRSALIPMQASVRPGAVVGNAEFYPGGGVTTDGGLPIKYKTHLSVGAGPDIFCLRLES